MLTSALILIVVFTACSQQNNTAIEDSATPDEVLVTSSAPITTTIAETTETTIVARTEPTETTVVTHSEATTIKIEESTADIETPEETENKQEYDNCADTLPSGEGSTIIDNEQSEDYSNSDIDLIARTVYLESGGCGEYCQWLTASTILNLADRGGGVPNVVYDYNTFNVAEMIDSCSPSDLSYSVAQRVVSGDRDYNVMAFRAGYYHDFGTPYTNVDNVCFSTY